MAAWQVNFAIVPRRALGAPRTNVGNLIDNNWWAAQTLPADYARQLTAIASPAAHSREALQSWGDPDGNRIDVWSENGRAARITAHVDVRRLDARFGAMILGFARVADAVLMREDGLVIEPIVGAFGAALRNSDAWKFANDPAAHIAKYAEPDDDE